jgi:hypothetical protein
MNRRELLKPDKNEPREPSTTKPVHDGARYAEELRYETDGVDLIRVIQVLQEGLSPETWSWEPEHIAAASDTISVSTANRFSNRLAANGMVNIMPGDGLPSSWRAEHTYALTDEGRDFACCTMYRYYKTMKTDVTAYGCPDREVLIRAFNEHLGMNIQHVMRRVTQEQFKKHCRLTRFDIPSHIYDAYGI